MQSIENNNKILKQYKNFIKYLPSDFIEVEYSKFIETYTYESGLNKEISFNLYIQNRINQELCHQIKNGNIDLEIELLDKYMLVLEFIIRKLRINEDLDKEGILIKSIETYDGSKLFSLHILSIVRNRNNLLPVVSNEEIQIIESKEPNFESFDDLVKNYISKHQIVKNKPSYLDMLFIKLGVCNFIEDETLRKYVSLKFGHYKLYFTDEDISNILNIEIPLINQMYKKCLELLKQVMNGKIDKVIEYYASNQSKEKQVKLKNNSII